MITYQNLLLACKPLLEKADFCQSRDVDKQTANTLILTLLAHVRELEIRYCTQLVKSETLEYAVTYWENQYDRIQQFNGFIASTNQVSDSEVRVAKIENLRLRLDNLNMRCEREIVATKLHADKSRINHLKGEVEIAAEKLRLEKEKNEDCTHTSHQFQHDNFNPRQFSPTNIPLRTLFINDIDDNTPTCSRYVQNEANRNRQLRYGPNQPNYGTAKQHKQPDVGSESYKVASAITQYVHCKHGYPNCQLRIAPVQPLIITEGESDEQSLEDISPHQDTINDDKSEDEKPTCSQYSQNQINSGKLTCPIQESAGYISSDVSVNAVNSDQNQNVTTTYEQIQIPMHDVIDVLKTAAVNGIEDSNHNKPLNLPKAVENQYRTTAADFQLSQNAPTLLEIVENIMKNSVHQHNSRIQENTSNVNNSTIELKIEESSTKVTANADLDQPKKKKRRHLNKKQKKKRVSEEPNIESINETVNMSKSKRTSTNNKVGLTTTKNSSMEKYTKGNENNQIFNSNDDSANVGNGKIQISKETNTGERILCTNNATKSQPNPCVKPDHPFSLGFGMLATDENAQLLVQQTYPHNVYHLKQYQETMNIPTNNKKPIVKNAESSNEVYSKIQDTTSIHSDITGNDNSMNQATRKKKKNNKRKRKAKSTTLNDDLNTNSNNVAQDDKDTPHYRTIPDFSENIALQYERGTNELQVTPQNSNDPVANKLNKQTDKSMKSTKKNNEYSDSVDKQIKPGLYKNTENKVELVHDLINTNQGNNLSNNSDKNTSNVKLYEDGKKIEAIKKIEMEQNNQLNNTAKAIKCDEVKINWKSSAVHAYDSKTSKQIKYSNDDTSCNNVAIIKSDSGQANFEVAKTVSDTITTGGFSDNSNQSQSKCVQYIRFESDEDMETPNENAANVEELEYTFSAVGMYDRETIIKREAEYKLNEQIHGNNAIARKLRELQFGSDDTPDALDLMTDENKHRNEPTNQNEFSVNSVQISPSEDTSKIFIDKNELRFGNFETLFQPNLLADALNYRNFPANANDYELSGNHVKTSMKFPNQVKARLSSSNSNDDKSHTTNNKNDNSTSTALNYSNSIENQHKLVPSNEISTGAQSHKDTVNVNIVPKTSDPCYDNKQNDSKKTIASQSHAKHYIESENSDAEHKVKQRRRICWADEEISDTEFPKCDKNLTTKIKKRNKKKKATNSNEVTIDSNLPTGSNNTKDKNQSFSYFMNSETNDEPSNDSWAERFLTDIQLDNEVYNVDKRASTKCAQKKVTTFGDGGYNPTNLNQDDYPTINDSLNIRKVYQASTIDSSSTNAETTNIFKSRKYKCQHDKIQPIHDLDVKNDNNYKHKDLNTGNSDTMLESKNIKQIAPHKITESIPISGKNYKRKDVSTATSNTLLEGKDVKQTTPHKFAEPTPTSGKNYKRKDVSTATSNTLLEGKDIKQTAPHKFAESTSTSGKNYKSKDVSTGNSDTMLESKNFKQTAPRKFAESTSTLGKNYNRKDVSTGTSNTMLVGKNVKQTTAHKFAESSSTSGKNYKRKDVRTGTSNTMLERKNSKQTVPHKLVESAPRPDNNNKLKNLTAVGSNTILKNKNVKQIAVSTSTPDERACNEVNVNQDSAISEQDPNQSKKLPLINMDEWSVDFSTVIKKKKRMRPLLPIKKLRGKPEKKTEDKNENSLNDVTSNETKIDNDNIPTTSKHVPVILENGQELVPLIRDKTEQELGIASNKTKTKRQRKLEKTTADQATVSLFTGNFSSAHRKYE